MVIEVQAQTQTKTIKVMRAYPVPDKKSTDKFGNPSRWILRLEDGRIAFPIDFTVDPKQEYYYVEIVVDAPRWAKVRLHVNHVPGEQLYGVCCKFKCALCGEAFEDCNHPLARKCLEEQEKERRERENYLSGIQYIAERMRRKMSEEIKMFNEMVKEMYRLWRNKPQRIIGYKVVGYENICWGWDVDDNGDFRCVSYGPAPIKEPIYNPNFDEEYEVWFNSARKVADKLIAVLRLFPIRCNSVYCTDGTRSEPGFILAALGISKCVIKDIDNFISEVYDAKNRYYDGFCP